GGHRRKNYCARKCFRVAKKRNREMLRRRYHPETETAGETKRRQKTNEEHRQDQHHPGSLHPGSQGPIALPFMFTRKYVKHGQLMSRHAEKLLRYRRDILAEGTMSDFRLQIEALRQSLKERNEAKAKEDTDRLHDLYTKHLPAPKDASWRENVEVILVAVVVAVGVRSYFLQPFKIPTGSMQPTLNGIIGHRAFVGSQAEIPVDQQAGYEKRAYGWYWSSYPTDVTTSNSLRQVAEFFVFGRNYINVVSAEDDEITEVRTKKIAFFFIFSEIYFRNQ